MARARRSTKTFSARWGVDVVERLDRRSESARTSKSELAERYVDEGIRMEAHPGIVFRGGPAGRRAALVGGPDVWELISFVKGLDERGQAAIEKAAELLNLRPHQVRAATGYYAEFRDEIDERIKRNAEQAEAAEAAWRREQAALA